MKEGIHSRAGQLEAGSSLACAPDGTLSIVSFGILLLAIGCSSLICSSPSLYNYPSAKAGMIMLLSWLKTTLVSFIPIELNSKFCFQTISMV